jgi:hypothetical protein
MGNVDFELSKLLTIVAGVTTVSAADVIDRSIELLSSSGHFRIVWGGRIAQKICGLSESLSGNCQRLRIESAIEAILCVFSLRTPVSDV